MKPIEFAEQNATYAKYQPEYLPLPSYKHSGAQGRVTSCWQLTDVEKLVVGRTGIVWLSLYTFNQALQPILLSVRKGDMGLPDQGKPAAPDMVGECTRDTVLESLADKVDELEENETAYKLAAVCAIEAAGKLTQENADIKAQYEIVLKDRDELAQIGAKVEASERIGGPDPHQDGQEECKLPGPGWYCTRAAGHEGPCAAWVDCQVGAAGNCVAAGTSRCYPSRSCRVPRVKARDCATSIAGSCPNMQCEYPGPRLRCFKAVKA